MAIPLERRINDLEVAVDAAWLSYKQTPNRGFDSAKLRAQRYARVDLLLEYLSPLYIERAVHGPGGLIVDCDTPEKPSA